MTIQKYILSFFVFLFTVVAAISQETTIITDVVDKTLIDKHFPVQKLPDPPKEIDDNTEKIVQRWTLKNACNNSATRLQRSVPKTSFNRNETAMFSDIVRNDKSSPICNVEPIAYCCNYSIVCLSPCCCQSVRFTVLPLPLVCRKSFISFGHTEFLNNLNNVEHYVPPQPNGHQSEKLKEENEKPK
ncbi:MAG: hypothetical protein LBF88_06275, partial [Planctomycetaceae bacterium]|nr:hypothetical protein [Planctomycetaceae bacterium]